MKLYDQDCESAKPREKAYKIFDGKGLYLEVTPTGSKLWRLKYRYLGKEKRISLGAYPIVTLAEAREKCLEARKLLARDIDPSAAKQERRREIIRNTFEAIALEWYENQTERWSKEYASDVLRRLHTDIFPLLGARPVDKIDAPELLGVLRRIEKRGALHTAKRAKQICGQIFRYGSYTGKCKGDITLHLRGALKTRKTRHLAAISPAEIPELLEALERNGAGLHNRTRRAIKLSLLTFQRPGEIRQAIKSEIDWDAKRWMIPAERMKMRRPHIVPLSRQALEVLKEQFEEIKHLNTQFIFPSQISPKKPMSGNAVRLALQRMGFKDRMTAHGFRPLARTAIREKLDYAPDVIDAQLAHKPAGSMGEAYIRSVFLKERIVMMQAWADYLDGMAATGREVTPAQPLPVRPISISTNAYRIVYLNYPLEEN